MAAVSTLAASPPTRDPYGDALSAPGWDSGGDSGSGKPLPLSRYRTGIWFALVPVAMLFTAFGSAYVVRQGLGDDWQPTVLPPLLWWNSIPLLVSSVTMEMARRRGRLLPPAGSEPDGRVRPFTRIPSVRRWLLATLSLGVLFLAGQVLLWQTLAQRGIYLASNPSSSFLYLLTVTHGLHICFGLAGLAALTVSTWRRLTPGGRTGLGVASVYWHFMGAVWIYVVALLVLAP